MGSQSQDPTGRSKYTSLSTYRNPSHGTAETEDFGPGMSLPLLESLLQSSQGPCSALVSSVPKSPNFPDGAAKLLPPTGLSEG